MLCIAYSSNFAKNIRTEPLSLKEGGFISTLFTWVSSLPEEIHPTHSRVSSIAHIIATHLITESLLESTGDLTCNQSRLSPLTMGWPYASYCQTTGDLASHFPQLLHHKVLPPFTLILSSHQTVIRTLFIGRFWRPTPCKRPASVGLSDLDHYVTGAFINHHWRVVCSSHQLLDCFLHSRRLVPCRPSRQTRERNSISAL